MHLCIREFSPNFSGDKNSFNFPKHETDARWTLGFADAETCEAAALRIAEETCKQRSFVESLLAPVLYDNSLGEEADSHNL